MSDLQLLVNVPKNHAYPEWTKFLGQNKGVLNISGITHFFPFSASYLYPVIQHAPGERRLVLVLSVVRLIWNLDKSGLYVFTTSILVFAMNLVTSAAF